MPKLKAVRIIWRVTQFLIVLYLAVIAFLFFAQRKLIFVPARDSQEHMAKLAEDHGFEAWQNGSGQFIGWKQLSKAKREHGRLLIVHGNGGCAVDRVDYADGLQSVEPMDVYILEYPGYGARGGTSSEKSFFAAASEAMESLKAGGPVCVMGESLGTGVAAYLAGTYPELVRGMLLLAPYDNLTEVAADHMPFFIPARLLLRDRFPSSTYLKNYHGPIAMLFAGQDTVVPNRFGHELYEGYQGAKKFWEIPQAGHNDLLKEQEVWWREVADFWKTNAPTGK